MLGKHKGAGGCRRARIDEGHLKDVKLVFLSGDVAPRFIVEKRNTRIPIQVTGELGEPFFHHLYGRIVDLHRDHGLLIEEQGGEDVPPSPRSYNQHFRVAPRGSALNSLCRI